MLMSESQLVPPRVHDSGDLGCGELLMDLHLIMETLLAGQELLLFSNDPAAPVDLRAWCRMRGYAFLGDTVQDGRPAYRMRKNKL